ncbi:uncharacterized protein TM35_000351380 [Trypanosoma theileri]|uniref:SKP1 component POZ domain-containing protein n=1 Tax=Trypanosoma theileri TaxID=67003 RepID=A0A1X0NKU4_9TRYP|nr:uncharacterized protein TM35_000351380 [Trypanosoma theileri]ORC85394.1 hypothetical protein TM35_000351380 [Trypanosoma theileri]
MSKPRSTRPDPISYVCVVSGEGTEFILPEAAVRQSKMLASLLDGIYCLPNRGGFGDQQRQRHATPGVYVTNNINVMPRIPLAPLSTRTLELVVRYLLQRSLGDPNSTEEYSLLSELSPVMDEDQDAVADVLLAADFLDC